LYFYKDLCKNICFYILWSVVMEGEQEYLDLLKDILDNGIESGDRTGTGTYSLFGRQIRFDLSKGFPLLTTKKVFFKGVLIELLWLLRGDTNIKWLNKHGVKIWDQWGDKNGDLGPVYGKNWRDWESPGTEVGDILSFDQISNVINRIKTNPNCRRLIVSAWNVGEIDRMKLPPCHCFFQFYVRNNKLSCQLYQRSADALLGVPFNIASYALLTHLIANECGLEVGEFVHTFGDVHLYKNHIEQAKEQISREPFPFPKLGLELLPGTLMEFIDKRVYTMDYKDINGLIYIKNYQSHPPIKADVSV